MKKIITLLALLSIFIGLKTNVYAATYTDKFIISEVIDGIYYAKEKNGTIEYRKAKFKRRVDDNQIVYCIEPFVDMAENTSYKGYDYNYENILKLSKEDWERISLLAYYGYGYSGHEAEKWYPITQLLIWATIDKEADFYYTKTYKGSRVTKYIAEINELEKLVANHNIKPSFDSSDYNMSINSTLTITDENKVLENYEVVTNDLVKIDGNNLVIMSTEEEESITITLQKKDKRYSSLPIIYVSNTYQNVLAVGSYETITSSLNLTIESGSVKITKVDQETNSIIPQGEASLVGTVYELYDENNNYVNQIVIDEDSTGLLKKVKYGDYKLIETVSGNGYLLDKKEYFFSINEENKKIELELSNQVVKRKIKLIKYMNQEKESNITFQIFNKYNELVKEVTTNENGEVEFELAYGTYLVKQINTTEGYYKVDDFEIKIIEENDEILEYYLYDIKVPDTNQNSNMAILIVIFILSTTGLYLLKKNEKVNS